MLPKKFWLVMLLVICLLTGLPIRAQESGLTADELAQLDRALAAVQQIDQYSSYVINALQTEQSTVLLTFGENQQETRSNISREVASAYIFGDTENVHANVTVTVEDVVNDNTTAYTMQSEVRIVEERMYVQAGYRGGRLEWQTEQMTNAAPTLPDLPIGWVVVDDPANFPTLKHLNLSDLVDKINREDYNPLIHNPELVKSLVESVTVGSTTLSNNQTLDVITFTIDGQGLITLLQSDPAFEADSDLAALLLLELSPTSIISFSVGLDAAGSPIQSVTQITLVAENVDFNALDPENVPPGVIGTFNNTITTNELYSQVNAALTPITAPGQ